MIDLASRGILVNVIQPGPIETDANPANGPFADMMKNAVALRRLGQPAEIANVVSFLASDQASFVTGVVSPGVV